MENIIGADGRLPGDVRERHASAPLHNRLLGAELACVTRPEVTCKLSILPPKIRSLVSQISCHLQPVTCNQPTHLPTFLRVFCYVMLLLLQHVRRGQDGGRGGGTKKSQGLVKPLPMLARVILHTPVRARCLQ